MVWHQRTAREANVERAALQQALAVANDRIRVLERASHDAAEIHADRVRTMTEMTEAMTVQVDRGRLSEEELEHALSDARVTIDELRTKCATAASDHARKVAQLGRCGKMRWRHLEHELHEVREREAEAAAGMRLKLQSSDI